MKSSELRIGNIVQTKKYKSIIMVKNYIGLASLGCGNIDNDYDEFDPFPEDIEPIPLTEEWLLKFGFEKIEHAYDKGLLSISMPSNDILLWKKGRTYFNSWRILDAPKHVHQLQNLYFALTGEELTIE